MIKQRLIFENTDQFFNSISITLINMIDLGERGELDLSSRMSPDNKPTYPLMGQFWVEFQKS